MVGHPADYHRNYYSAFIAGTYFDRPSLPMHAKEGSSVQT